MAKKDKNQTEEEAQVQAEGIETEETKPPKADKPDLSGLVKMTKDGKEIHAHPHVVDHHKKNGWKLA